MTVGIAINGTLYKRPVDDFHRIVRLLTGVWKYDDESDDLRENRPFFFFLQKTDLISSRPYNNTLAIIADPVWH